MRDIIEKAKREVRVPIIEKAHRTYGALGPGGRAVFFLLATLIVLSGAGLLYLLNSSLMTTAPAHGGSLTEGIVGSPRFINPLLAISDADQDLTKLVYAGLLKPTPEGDFIPDLASTWEVSDDGRTYTATIREDAVFQDGNPVTAEDVVFTVSKAQDPALKSPQRAGWDGIGVEAQGERTVVFMLRTAYAPFVENLTLGILPKHLWQGVSAEEFPFSELNTTPVGAGPFMVRSVSRSASGIPTAYTLFSFSHYALGAPYLDTLTLRFYQNESELAAALRNGSVEAGSGISPASLNELKGRAVVSAPLDRVFGVFFNQNQSSILRDASVRAALEASVDRADLIEKVLGGYGTPVMGPIPPTISGSASTSSSATSTEALALMARERLIRAGWKEAENGFLAKSAGSGKNAQSVKLSFTLSTGNVAELKAAAEYLKAQWAKVGAEVVVEIYEQGGLSENIIRPRKYDALLFGEVVGRGLDLFAFWDSSQRNDPGLNIALYANASVDVALGKLRVAATEKDRQSLYAQIESQIKKDIPAIFLYSPDFLYVFPPGVRGLELGFVSVPSDRFLSAAEWYRETERVWPFLAPERAQVLSITY